MSLGGRRDAAWRRYIVKERRFATRDRRVSFVMHAWRRVQLLDPIIAMKSYPSETAFSFARSSLLRRADDQESCTVLYK